MSQNGIRYTDEFNKQLVDLYQAGSSVSYLSREYGAYYKALVGVSSKRQVSADRLKAKIKDLAGKQSSLWSS